MSDKINVEKIENCVAMLEKYGCNKKFIQEIKNEAISGTGSCSREFVARCTEERIKEWLANNKQMAEWGRTDSGAIDFSDYNNAYNFYTVITD